MRGFYEVPGAITSYNLPASSATLRNPDTGVLLQSAEGKVSSLHVEKADYFKLQNLSIGYNFNMNPGAAFTKIRIYFAGNNLATWSGYQGVEPEVRFTDDSEDNAGLNNPLAPGIDRRETWFLARSYALGISLGF
jgi:iron complex outermembrane receptor protein